MSTRGFAESDLRFPFAAAQIELFKACIYGNGSAVL